MNAAVADLFEERVIGRLDLDALAPGSSRAGKCAPGELVAPGAREGAARGVDAGDVEPHSDRIGSAGRSDRARGSLWCAQRSRATAVGPPP